MGKTTVATRLPGWLAGELESWTQGPDASRSAFLRRLTEDEWVRRELPNVVFRGESDDRRAALEDGPDVWKVVGALPRAQRDPEVLADRFDGLLERTLVGQVVRYYERLPERVDAEIERNARAARTLRHLATWSVPIPPSGWVAGWLVAAGAVTELRDRGVEVVPVAELGAGATSTEAVVDRLDGLGRGLLTADYRAVGSRARKKPASLPVGLLDADLARASARAQAAAIAAWLDAGEGDERGPWIGPVDDG